MEIKRGCRTGLKQRVLLLPSSARMAADSHSR